MDYAEYYTEDIRLTKNFLSKRFPHLKRDEDIISMCVIKLWEKRANYNPAIAKYSTYAFQWLQQVMSEYNKKRYAKKRQYQTISIYTEISDDLTILDTLAADDNSACQYVKEVVHTVLDKNENLRPIIGYFMQGYQQKEIAAALDLSIPQISYSLRKFRKLCRQEHLRSEL